MLPHHHGDDREEIPVALDSGEAKRKHIGEEDHGRTKANSTKDLRLEKEGHESWINGKGVCCLKNEIYVMSKSWNREAESIVA